jgi:ArsR family transcriptional regulator
MAGSAAEAARLMQLMGHGGRLMLLCHLSQGEQTVGEIQAKLGIGQSALSQHLGRLRSEGLVTAEREGTHMRYRLSSPEATSVLETLHRLYCTA